MRTVIIAICLLMGYPTIILAQEQDDSYFPMLQDGKKWVTLLTEAESAAQSIQYIDGDTLINGRKWKRVYSKFDVQDYCYFGAIRQEQEKVYGIIAGKEEPYLFYDFGLQVGDTINCRGNYYDNFGYVYYICFTDSQDADGLSPSMENIQSRPEIPEIAIQTVTVEKIDTIKVRGHEFRRFTLKNYYLLKAPSDTPFFQYPYFVWVEGIGCEGGLFVSGRKIRPWTQLYCMMDDMVIFEYDDFHVPGISDGINPVPAPMLEDTNLYDLTGRRLTAPPARGIYIRNGRKYVVK